MLRISELSKSFGSNLVLDNVALTIDAQKIYALLGPNGSGKTTLFNIITGYLKPDKGTIEYCGHGITRKPPAFVNRLGIGRTFQDVRLIANMSVKENVLLAFNPNPGEGILAAMLPSKLFKKQYEDMSRRATEILEKLFLSKVAENLAGKISYGQQKLLCLACCIANDSKLLLLDEPTAGITAGHRDIIKDILVSLKKNGKTVFLIEHNADFVRSLSDEVFFIYRGRISKYADYNTFSKDEIVNKAYF